MISKGLALDALGRYEDAIDYYAKAVELEPDLEIRPILTMTWYNKGNALFAQRNYDDANKCYNRALELDSNFVLAWIGKGVIRYNQGNYNKAVSCFEKAIVLDSKFVDAWNNKGLALVRLGLNEDAIMCFDKAIDLDNQNTTAWEMKGLALRGLNKYEDAINSYKKVNEINPRCTTTIVSLAACYKKLGREAKRLEQCKIASKLIDGETEYVRACFEAVCGDVENALALLKTILEKNQAKRDWMSKDPDLESIRDSYGFKELLNEC